MSEIRKITVFKTSTAVVRIADAETCKKVEEDLKEFVYQRIEKLDIILRNLNVCEVIDPEFVDTVYGGLLFVNDKYETQEDLKQIAEAFGLIVQEVEVPLRGKSYLIYDALARLLKITKNETLSKYSYKITEEVERVLKEYSAHITGAINNTTLENVIKTVLSRGTAQHTLTRKIEEKHDIYGKEDRLLSSRETGRTVTGYSDTEFVRDVADIFEKQKGYMQNGVCGILESRAKQLGYKVTKNTAGDTVQFAFVRLQ